MTLKVNFSAGIHRKINFYSDKRTLTAGFGEIYMIDSGGVNFIPGNALEITPDGVLNVLTTDTADADNTLPITSAGVHTIVGNIGAILDTI